VQFKHITIGNRINNTKEKTQRIANPMGPRLLPLRKAAEYLGLTVWAMRERIWAGEIPVVRFPGGRKMFIDVKDIDAFIEKNKTVVA
jgi:excisionase family DNA binding protein